jgi:hypothetical protein
MPEQMIIPFRTDQVEGAVFTGTQPTKSLPLNNGRNPSFSTATDSADNKTTAKRQTNLVLLKSMMGVVCPQPSTWPSGIPRSNDGLPTTEFGGALLPKKQS